MNEQELDAQRYRFLAERARPMHFPNEPTEFIWAILLDVPIVGKTFDAALDAAIAEATGGSND